MRAFSMPPAARTKTFALTCDFAPSIVLISRPVTWFPSALVSTCRTVALHQRADVVGALRSEFVGQIS